MRLTNRAGFTLIELVVVITIGTIMMGYAIPKFTEVVKAKSAENARDNLVWMATRARAKAIERGTVWELAIEPANDKARIIERGATTALDSVNFANEFNSTVSTSDNAAIVLCYSPRGFAFSCDAGSPTANVDVTFTYHEKSAQARVKPLGQIERL